MRDCARYSSAPLSVIIGLVVVGYSGTDASIMEALAGAAGMDGAFPTGFYWVTRSGTEQLPAVQRLLDSLTMSGVDAHIVEAETFDEFAGELERQVTLPEVLADHVKTARPTAIVQPVALPTVEARPFPVLRLSALRVLDLPTRPRRVTFTNPVTAGDVRSALKVAGVRAVIACLGREDPRPSPAHPFQPSPTGGVSPHPDQITVSPR